MKPHIIVAAYLRRKSWCLYAALVDAKYKYGFYSPTHKFAESIAPEILGKHILDLIGAAPKTVPEKVSEKNKTAFLKAAGVDDWEKLYKDTQYCQLEIHTREIVFIPYEATSYGPSCTKINNNEYRGQSVLPVKSAAEQIGEELLKTMKTAMSWDKRVAKKQNAATKVNGNISPKVLKEIIRLGGKFQKKKPAKKVINNFLAPEPIRQFLFDVSWPKSAIYENSDDDTFWVWSLELGYFDTNAREEQPFLKKYTDAAFFGSSDGGNDSMLLFMDSKNPADPLVYRLQHDDYEERDWEKEEDFIPLSEFLRSLRRKKGKT